MKRAFEIMYSFPRFGLRQWVEVVVEDRPFRSKQPLSEHCAQTAIFLREEIFGSVPSFFRTEHKRRSDVVRCEGGRAVLLPVMAEPSESVRLNRSILGPLDVATNQR